MSSTGLYQGKCLLDYLQLQLVPIPLHDHPISIHLPMVSPVVFSGRVYLMGDNTRCAPWSLTQTVPAGLEEMVLEHRWQQLSTQLKKAAEARWT